MGDFVHSGPKGACISGGDVAEVLHRWDEGWPVWSVEMGGLGPGYEQAIQNTAFAILRFLHDGGFDHGGWDDRAVWLGVLDQIERDVMPKMEGEGLSGSQWGAAVNIASVFYRQGHRNGLDMAGRDRWIQVTRAAPRNATRNTTTSAAGPEAEGGVNQS